MISDSIPALTASPAPAPASTTPATQVKAKTKSAPQPAQQLEGGGGEGAPATGSVEKAVTAPTTSVLPEETAPVAAPGETATTGTDETTPDPEHAVAGRAVTCSNGGDAGGSAGLHAGYVLVSADALAATKAMCSLKNGGATTSTSMRSKDKKLVLGSTVDNKEVSVVCNQVFIDKRDSGDDIYASGLAMFAPRVKDKCIQ